MKTRPRDSNPRAAACVVTYLAARRGAARRGAAAAERRRRCGGGAAERRRCGGEAADDLACVYRLSAHARLSSRVHGCNGIRALGRQWVSIRVHKLRGSS